MDKGLQEPVARIRAFNRFYTKVIGLLNGHILSSPYSLAEVRVLLEIGTAGECTATKLIEMLVLDPGYLSRMLARLEKDGLIDRHKSAVDRRVTLLRLTAKGTAILKELTDTADAEIIRLISTLSAERLQSLVTHMNAIEAILAGAEAPAVTLRDYRPGDLGYIDYMHCRLYEEQYDLDPGFFEKHVLPGLTELAVMPDKSRSKVWIAEVGGEIIGTIGIVERDTATAQLRWFLISAEHRGTGLGKKLLATAMDYCRSQQYRQIYLWTMDFLKTARHLYKTHGFNLTEAKETVVRGRSITEERWDIKLL